MNTKGTRGEYKTENRENVEGKAKMLYYGPVIIFSQY